MANETLLPELSVRQLKELKENKALNRRRFMAGLGLTGAAVAGAGLLAGCNDSPSSSTGTTAVAAGPSQTDVLNFALNLEYLEATFYSFLALGIDLPSSSTTGSGAITGSVPKLQTGVVTNAATQIQVSQQVLDMFSEIAYDEISHVADLRTALSSSAVARPALNASALGAYTATNFISFARVFEDVGVTAYAGAAALLSGANLTYAAQILAVEGFHAGALRLLIIQSNATTVQPTLGVMPQIAENTGTSDTYDVKPLDPGAAVATNGPTTTTGGYFATAGTANASATVFPAFAYTRTTSQVLSIVYGTATAGTTKGGFYPSGMTGNIMTI